MGKPTGSPSTSRVLLPVGVGVALSLLGDQTLYTVLPHAPIAAQAGVTLGMVGILLGINRLTRVVTNVPVGILYSWLPRRALMLASMSIAALSTMLYAVGGVGVLLFGRVLWGLAWSGIWIGSNMVALDISSHDDRGRITGRLQSWFFLGIGLTSLLGGVFTDTFGYRHGLWISAALTALAVLLWAFFLPETSSLAKGKVRQTTPIVDISSTQVDDRHQPSFPWAVTFQVSVPLFILRLVFAGVLTSTTILWLAQFVERGIAVSGLFLPLATLTGAFVAARVLLSMLSAPLSGSISDRLGSRWLVLAVVLFLGAAGLWMMGSLWMAAALGGAALATISAGSIQGLVPALIGDRVGLKDQSKVLGVVYSFADLGSAIGPVIALTLVQFVGLGFLYRLCALLFGLVGVFAFSSAIHEKRLW